MTDYPSMISKDREPLMTMPVNGTFLLGVYQGSISKYDLLLKYRQLGTDGRWSHIRTPKHIHWAVDILIKLYAEKEKTQEFLNFLLDYWKQVTPLTSDLERENLLNTATLLAEVDKEAQYYKELSGKGEYSVKFLILVAKLLMVQEKTNRPDAHMFKEVLESLRDGDDIFKVVSAASFRG